MLLIFLSSAWLVGVFLGSKFSLPAAAVPLGLLPFGLSFLTRWRRRAVMLGLSLIALLGGAAWYQSSLPETGPDKVHFHNEGGVVQVRGIVVRSESRNDASRLYLSTREIQLEDEWEPVSGTVLLSVPRYPAYGYGDLILVTGKLETPPQLEDFDYRGYLAHNGIYSVVRGPEIAIVATAQGSWAMARLYGFRDRLSKSLDEALPEPQASLAQGIVLGIRSNIPDALKNDFIVSGTMHVLAISGQNLTIVTGLLLSLAVWLFGRRFSLHIWLTLVVIWLYALITGGLPPVMRSAIMASLFLFAELMGRQRSAIVYLVFAAAIMAGVSPHILWDASFQLSFLSMFGLAVISPLLQQWGNNLAIAGRRGTGKAGSAVTYVVESLSVSAAATIAVWPVVAHYFGLFSVVAPVATFFVLPALSGAILLGGVVGVLGMAAMPVARIVAWLAWILLSYMLLAVSLFARLPHASLQINLDSPFVASYYVVLAVALLSYGHRTALRRRLPPAFDKIKAGMLHVWDFLSLLPRKLVVPPLILLAALALAAAIAAPDGRLHVSFLDVGQGDATLIRHGSQQVLVDGGPSAQAVMTRLGKEMPFWDRTIELVVLTHPHADHISGLVEVLRRYRVERVLFVSQDSGSPVFREWLDLIEGKRVETTSARSGLQVNAGAGVAISVLNPVNVSTGSGENDVDNDSVVLQVRMDQITFLLTGDIGWETELDLIGRRADLASTVLKVAHHGSASSSSPEFLAVVNPRAAVISAGRDNPYGHPHPQTLNSLGQEIDPANIYRTDENGTIEFITDGKRLWVKTAR